MVFSNRDILYLPDFPKIFLGYETWTFCSQMPWLPWRKLWREIRFVWTTVSWRVLALHQRRGKITWRGWRLQATTPGSIAPLWPSLPDRSADGWAATSLPPPLVWRQPFLLGLFKSVCNNARWPWHARHLWCLAQHCQSGGACGGWQTENPACPPERFHARLPTAPPPHPCRLPGICRDTNASFTHSLWGWLLFNIVSSPADRPASTDRRDHGNLQLCSHGDRTRHDWDIWNHMSRGGTTHDTHWWYTRQNASERMRHW